MRLRQIARYDSAKIHSKISQNEKSSYFTQPTSTMRLNEISWYEAKFRSTTKVNRRFAKELIERYDLVSWITRDDSAKIAR